MSETRTCEAVAARSEYSPPVLEEYGDMADLTRGSGSVDTDAESMPNSCHRVGVNDLDCDGIPD